MNHTSKMIIISLSLLFLSFITTGTQKISPKIIKYSNLTDITFISPTLRFMNKDAILNSISMGFNTIFRIQTASAIVDCARPGGIPELPGPNLWAPCCNCFAGPYPIGCLNYVCVYWPAAIYDQTTGMCGCG